MIRLLAMLPLTGCLLAPDRPPDAIITGDELTLDPPACLDSMLLDTFAVGAATTDEGNAIWRAAIVGGQTHVWEFVPSLAHDAECFELGFAIPDAAGYAVAIDASRLDSQVVVAVMIANPALSFAEIAISGDHAVLASHVDTQLLVHPDTLANTDDLADFSPRYLHRTDDGLWFGGGDQIGFLPESSPGVAALPTTRAVTNVSSQSWVDAAPPGFVIGESEICAVDAELSCTVIHSHHCPAGQCHVQATGPLAIDGIAGFAAEQPGQGNPATPNAAELDVIRSSGGVSEVLLAPPDELMPWFQGVTVTGARDGLALWYPSNGPFEPGELAFYASVLDGTSTTPTTTPAPAYGDDATVVSGTFAGVDAAVILGDHPADLTCVAIGSFNPCTPGR